MAKVKIYELAKELGVESKEVIEFLWQKEYRSQEPQQRH